MIAPEFFSEKANFLAFDEDAFESLLRKILVKEVRAGLVMYSRAGMCLRDVWVLWLAD